MIIIRTNGFSVSDPLVRRRHLLVALAFVAVAVYGSLVPFGFRSLAVAEAVARLKYTWNRPLNISRTDFVANVLLFVPIGYCLAAAFAVGQTGRLRTMLSATLILLVCGATSVAIEAAQIWFPGRTPSRSDVIAQLLGTTFGIVLWPTVGSTLTGWLGSYIRLQGPRDRVDWLLKAYFVGLLVYSVLPLDLTISPRELFHKYREGKIVLVPFSGFQLGAASLCGLLRDTIVFIPVGMLVMTAVKRSWWPVRQIIVAAVLGGLLILAIELTQLFVYSRHTATDDVIVGIGGVWIGAWVMQRWRGSDAGQYGPPVVLGGRARQAWMWFGLAGVYSVFLVVLFCTPFHPIDDVPQIRVRLEGFLRLPFASFQRATVLNAVSEVLKKSLLFAPLGVFYAFTVAQSSFPRPVRRILLGTLLLIVAVVATGIEMAQVFLPPHVPDVTDVLLCVAGAATAMFITAQILDSGATPPLSHGRSTGPTGAVPNRQTEKRA
ncbi:MAG: VanZ family protein [Pirellulales bacterium]|nr:VanZ family protein [Pirellulales bacterium]